MNIKSASRSSDSRDQQAPTQHLKLIPELNDLQGLPPELRNNPELAKLVREYCELAMKPKLSEEDMDRISTLYKLAEIDEALDHWIAEIDSRVDLTLLILRDRDKLTLEDFIREIKEIPPNEMTIERFASLAEKVELRDDLIRQHSRFQEHEYSRQTICQTSFGAIFVISWRPGQHGCTHRHGSDLSVIYPYQGEITQELYRQEPEWHDVNGEKVYRIKYVFETKRSYAKNNVVYVDNYQSHRLINASLSDTITVHFRYFKHSSAG